MSSNLISPITIERIGRINQMERDRAVSERWWDEHAGPMERGVETMLKFCVPIVGGWLLRAFQRYFMKRTLPEVAAQEILGDSPGGEKFREVVEDTRSQIAVLKSQREQDEANNRERHESFRRDLSDLRSEVSHQMEVLRRESSERETRQEGRIDALIGEVRQCFKSRPAKGEKR